MILSILKLRKDIHELYKKHNRIANLVLKGVGALLLFLSLNRLYNNNEAMMLILAVGLALVCAVIPTRFVYAASTLITAVHLWQISWDMALCYVALVFLSWVLICRIRPETGIIIAYAPLLFTIKIPFLLPLLVGMLSSLFGVGAMVFGVLFYFVGEYSSTVGAALLSSVTSGEATLVVQSVMAGLAGNADFILLVGACVIAAVVTYIVYHQAFDYAWYISCVAGGIAGLAAYLAGGIMFEIEHASMIYIFTIPVAMCIACALQFLRCIIDYSGVEYTEFEDDDFYYYVKAVPKVNVIVEDFAMIDEAKNQAAKKEETMEEDK